MTAACTNTKAIIDEFERVLVSTIEMFTGESLLKAPSLSEETEWIGAAISLDGDDCLGGLSFFLTTAVALKLTTALTGMEISTVNSDVQEAVCEVTNIVAGSTKAHLSTLGLNPGLATPFFIEATKTFSDVQELCDEEKSLFFQGFGGGLALLIDLAPVPNPSNYQPTCLTE